MRCAAICFTLPIGLVSGCSNYSSNLQVGNDQSYTSPKDQRGAIRTAKVYKALPSGAEILSVVFA